MVSRLVRSTPERAVRVGTLAGDIVLCSWARHFISHSASLHPGVSANCCGNLTNCWGNLTNCGEVICDGLASRPGEVEILLAASYYRNRDKLRQLSASIGSKASHFTLPPTQHHTFFRNLPPLSENKPEKLCSQLLPRAAY